MGSKQRIQHLKPGLRGRSSVGLERLPVTQKVAGSSPVGPARNQEELS